MIAGLIDYVYWDSCVLLDYIQKTPERIAILDEQITHIRQTGERKIITSVLSTTEVAYVAHEKRNRQLDPIIEERLDGLWADYAIIEIVDVQIVIAVQARTLLRQAVANNVSLKPPDALHLATALWLRTQGMHLRELYTYDQKLLACSTLVDFTICEPYNDE